MKYLNTIEIPLRWHDLDAYAHVGNSRYYDFMTDARVAILGAKHVLQDLKKQYVVVESGCKFKKPLYYPGTVILKQSCSKVGNSSFTLHYEFYMADKPEELCAEGFVIMVCYDAKLKQAVRLETIVRELLD